MVHRLALTIGGLGAVALLGLAMVATGSSLATSATSTSAPGVDALVDEQFASTAGGGRNVRTVVDTVYVRPADAGSSDRSNRSPEPTSSPEPSSSPEPTASPDPTRRPAATASPDATFGAFDDDDHDDDWDDDRSGHRDGDDDHDDDRSGHRDGDDDHDDDRSGHRDGDDDHDDDRSGHRDGDDGHNDDDDDWDDD